MQGSGSGGGLSGQTIGGRYQLRSLLGRGGFAEVFRAWDNLDDVEVAFKVLKVPGHLSEAAQREFVARFHEEAKLTRKMFKGMPHVRQVLDMGVAELAGLPQPWMAMELLEGETLHEWLRRRRGSPTRLPPREALALLRPVLEATAFAHERGVAHRDLKPANIFLTRDPSGGGHIVKVLDFGIAKVLQGDEEASGNTMTSSTMQMFSPQYGAPEQFAAKKTGKYTDVFALGLIMTELCTDRAPLSEDGDRTECMMASLDKRERPSPRSASVEVGPALEAALLRAVALKEAERHTDAGELLRELSVAVGAEPAPGPTQRSAAPATQPATQPAVTQPATQPAVTQPATQPTTQPAVTQPAATEREVATSFSEIVPEFDPRIVTKPARPEPPAEEGRGAQAREPESDRGVEPLGAHPPQGPGFAPSGFAPPARAAASGGSSTRVIVGAVVGALALLVGAGVVGTAAIGAAKDKADALDAAAIAEALRHWDDSESPVPITAADPMWGARDAPATLVIFSDFQCPYCSKAALTLEQLRADYGPEKLRMVWKNEPLAFHDKARGAAEAAAGVFALGGSPAFWSFHDAAFKDQASLGPEAYKKWATAADVDAAKLEAGLAGHTWAEKVDKDLAVAKELGASGTPTFFVNGVKLVGAQPVEKFKELIDKEIEKANKAIAAGTPKTRVYVETSKANKSAPEKPDEREPEKEDTTTVFKVPVGASPVRGSATALVTIVEFSDYQCPFCARVEPTLKQLGEKYGSRLRFVWKDQPLPFHKRAMPATVLAREARAQKGEAGFWQAHDALFVSREKLEDDDLVSLARTLGLDNFRLKTALSIGKFKAEIDADVALAERLGANGIPHFFINGRRMSGAQPIEKFTKIIDEELAKASALIAAGTPPSGVYEALTRQGLESPEPRAPSDVAAPPASATTTASGLAYRVLRKGTGAQHPGPTSKVTVHYEGWTTDGKAFDWSRKRGSEPASFALGMVIAGWTEGLQLMVPGEKTRFWIPAKLAYGDTPKGGGPKGTLVFDIELFATQESAPAAPGAGTPTP